MIDDDSTLIILDIYEGQVNSSSWQIIATLIFSLIEQSNKTGSCPTIPMWSLNHPTFNCLISVPSISTLPSSGSRWFIKGYCHLVWHLMNSVSIIFSLLQLEKKTLLTNNWVFGCPSAYWLINLEALLCFCRISWQTLQPMTLRYFCTRWKALFHIDGKRVQTRD